MPCSPVSMNKDCKVRKGFVVFDYYDMGRVSIGLVWGTISVAPSLLYVKYAMASLPWFRGTVRLFGGLGAGSSSITRLISQLYRDMTLAATAPWNCYNQA